ncbi:MAG: hypothetical protein ACRDRV_19780 [Pseudonocardiaceae bacterium]
MSYNDEAELCAVQTAVAGAVGQARLDAGVNLTGLLIDMDRADSIDCRRFFMCWQLTRVLAPSLAEKVSPAVVRHVLGRISEKQQSTPEFTTQTSRPFGQALSGDQDYAPRAPPASRIQRRQDSQRRTWSSSSPVSPLAA